jgi:hypothetical protein
MITTCPKCGFNYDVPTQTAGVAFNCPICFPTVPIITSYTGTTNQPKSEQEKQSNRKNMEEKIKELATNQPNTEDGNEWLDDIMCEITYDGCYQPDGLEEAKDEIKSYIQSNYILKSDVEKIIGLDFVYEQKGREFETGFINAIKDDQRQRAKAMGIDLCLINK